MSRVTELAEAEAARVEAELEDETSAPDEPAPDVAPTGDPGPDSPDADEPAPAEPVPEEEAEEAESESPTPEQLAHFERQVAKHEAALKRIMGDDFKWFVPCFQCEGVGHVPATPPAAVHLEHDPATEPCPVCKGYGELVTGSLKEQYAARLCGNCGGGGFITVSAPAPAPVAQAAFTANGPPSPGPGWIYVGDSPTT